VAGGPESRILTVPNVLSLVRLACIPLFLWLLFGRDDRAAAAYLLAILGATDWVDGYIARHFDQGSKIGKILDPIADRVLLIAGAVGLLIDGTAPRWVLILVLARELVVSLGTVWLAALGARRIDVQWVGKAGTLAVMFALPMFLWLDNTSPGTGHDVLAVITWGFTIGGLILSYYALLGYIPIAREALREGRAARTSTVGAQ
jgi:cardiolipin synthase